MLILDASGEFRQTYWFWHENRTGLEFLYSPGKRYDGLTIHHWDRAAGRKAYRDDYASIAKGVVRTINAEIPVGEPVLVVHFLPGKFIPDMEKAIANAVADNREIHYLTWGKHTATNDFHMVRHVVLAGILQYSVPENEATGRGAKGIKADDELSDADFNGTRFGEIAHNIFQAACRGYVRHSVGDGCPPGCHLYIIFSTHKATGVPRSWLNRIFPGSCVLDWMPVNRLSPQQMKLARMISDGAHDAWPYEARLAKAELSHGLGIRRQRMTELINDDLINYLRSEEGITIEIETRKVIAVAGYGVGRGGLSNGTTENEGMALPF